MNRFPCIPAASILLGALLLCAPGAAVAAPAAAEEMPMPLVLQWKFSSVDLGVPLPAGRNNPTAPIIVDEVAYVCARGVNAAKQAVTSVYALSLETGEKLWDFPLEGSVFATPAAADGKLWVVDSSRYLYVLDLKDKGKERVRFRLDRPTRCSPVIHDGVVYIGDNQGTVVAIDAKEERELWRARLKGAVDAPIAVSPQQKAVYIATDEPMLYALRMDKGAELWKMPLPDPNVDAAPIVWGNNLYVVSGPYLLCVTAHKGYPVWNSARMGSTTGKPIVGTPALEPDGKGGARIFFTCRDGSVNALNAKNGALAWKGYAQLDRVPRSSVALSGNTLLVGGDSGCLYAIDTSNGDLVWRYRAVPPSYIQKQASLYSVAGKPAVGNGRVVVLADEGTVFCFAPGNDTAAPEISGKQPDGTVAIVGKPPVRFEAVILDEGCGIDERKLVFKLDGKVEKHQFDSRTSKISYSTPVTQPLRPLPDGRHTISIKAVDWKGNTLEHEWTFDVDSRAVPPPPPAQPEAGFMP